MRRERFECVVLNALYCEKIITYRFTYLLLQEHGKQRVPEETVARVLNAFFHSLGTTSLPKKCLLLPLIMISIFSTTEPDSKIVYVQGLNVICGVFLYVMSELDAFYCFERFVKLHCAKYYYHNSVANAIRDGCEVICYI